MSVVHATIADWLITQHAFPGGPYSISTIPGRVFPSFDHPPPFLKKYVACSAPGEELGEVPCEVVCFADEARLVGSWVGGIEVCALDSGAFCSLHVNKPCPIFVVGAPIDVGRLPMAHIKPWGTCSMDMGYSPLCRH